jgi:hypothetical protein
MYTCRIKINQLAKECIDRIQKCTIYEEALELFYDYAYEIKSYGGNFEWFINNEGKEVFKVGQPDDTIYEI